MSCGSLASLSKTRSASLLAQYTEWRRINFVLEPQDGSIVAEHLESTVSISINGTQLAVPSGTTVAAALIIAGAPARLSASGEPRGPLCAMGVCMECCATINGIAHARSCLVTVQPGMQVTTG